MFFCLPNSYFVALTCKWFKNISLLYAGRNFVQRSLYEKVIFFVVSSNGGNRFAAGGNGTVCHVPVKPAVAMSGEEYCVDYTCQLQKGSL